MLVGCVSSLVGRELHGKDGEATPQERWAYSYSISSGKHGSTPTASCELHILYKVVHILYKVEISGSNCCPNPKNLLKVSF